MNYRNPLSKLCLFVFFTFLTCLLSTPLHASVYLQGQVTLNDQAYTGNASVSLNCSQKTSSGYYVSSCSDWGQINSSGKYSFDGSDDSYNCCASSYSGRKWDSCEVYAYQWESTSVANSEKAQVTFDCSTSKTQNLALRSKNKTIAVTVTAGSKTLTEGINVNCYENEGSYTSSSINSSTDGVYKVPILEGTFTCSAYCDWSYWKGGTCPYSGNPETKVTVGANDTTVAASLAFTTKDKTIRVAVKQGSKAVTKNICVNCNQQESPWTYGSTCTGSAEGTYDILVTDGKYYCSSSCNNWPCSDLQGSPNTTVTVKSSDTTVDAKLSYQSKDMKIRTTILAGKTSITSGMTVNCSQQGGTWDYTSDSQANSDGYYECSVGRGTYSVSAYCSDWNSCSLSGYPQATVKFSDNDTEGAIADVTLNYLDNNATVAGVVTDGTSYIPNVWININAHQISDSSGKTKAGALVLKDVEVSGGKADNNQVYLSAQTDSRGAFNRRVPAGTYTVSVYPPYDRQDLAQTSQEVTVSANGTTAITLSMTQKKSKIAGCVTDSGGKAVSASVNGWNYNSSTSQSDSFWQQTDSKGCYSVSAVEGYTYNVTASPNTWGNTSSTWCNHTTEGAQSVTATSGIQTINFTVPNCDCSLNVSVKDGAGEIVPIQGSLDCTPASFGSNEYYHGAWGQLSLGIVKMNVEPDKKYQCKAWFWDSKYTSGKESTCSCSKGSGSCTIELASIIDNAVSGGYKDGDGHALEVTSASYISVYATKGSNYRSCEATLSGYSCDLSEGTWVLGYWIDPNSGFASAAGGTTSSEIKVTSAGGVTQDITLLNTASIEVTALDLNESGRQNVHVECCPYSASQEGANSYQYHYNCGWGNTDSKGKTTVSVGATTGEGVTYYCNAYIPYGMRKEESLNNPQECSVKAIVGKSSECKLQYEKPDGSVTITVTEGKVAVSSTSALKMIVNAAESAASSPVAHATVDCFSPAGGSVETTSEVDGTAKISCTTDDKWYCVCHNLVSNALYVSKATEISCSAEGASGTCPLDYITTVPEAMSQSITDASTQALTLKLSDGFNVSFPPSSLGGANQSATCTTDAVVTPFTANKIPANFYGYFVQCLDSNGAAIQKLNADATFTMPCNSTQLKKMGLTENDVQCTYFDTSNGAYNQVTNATIDCANGISFSVNHLTDFAIVGNGFLGGVQGKDDTTTVSKENGGGDSGGSGGDSGSETGSATSSAGCGGCYTLASPPTGFDDRILWGALLFLYGLRVLRKKI